MYDAGLNFYRDRFFQKNYHIMKLKKRKDGLNQLKEEYIKNCYNFVKEYGNVSTRMARFVSANIKLDPFNPNILDGVQAKHCEVLDHQGLYTFHTGGFSNACLCFDGKVIVTNDHDLDFGFNDVKNDGVNFIPPQQCVIDIV